jgi:hypothetical protein
VKQILISLLIRSGCKPWPLRSGNDLSDLSPKIYVELVCWEGQSLPAVTTYTLRGSLDSSLAAPKVAVVVMYLLCPFCFLFWFCFFHVFTYVIAFIIDFPKVTRYKNVCAFLYYCLLHVLLTKTQTAAYLSAQFVTFSRAIARHWTIRKVLGPCSSTLCATSPCDHLVCYQSLWHLGDGASHALLTWQADVLLQVSEIMAIIALLHQ